MSRTRSAAMDFDKMFLGSETAKRRRQEALTALTHSKESIECHMDDALKFLFLLDAMYKEDPLVTKIREVISALNKRDRCKYMVVPHHFALGLDENGLFGLTSYDSKLVKEQIKTKHILQHTPTEKDFVEIGQMSVESIVEVFETSLANLSHNIEQNVVTVPIKRNRAVLQRFTDNSLGTVAKASAWWMVFQCSMGVLRKLRR